MPDKHVPPLWVLVLASALTGVIAQLGASLALDMARDRAKLYGFLLLSLVFSGTSTILLVEWVKMAPYPAAAIGSLLGSVPSLWTLRAGVKLIGQKYGVEIGEMSSAPPTTPPTTPPKAGDTP